MARPRYPSDEARKAFRPHVKVHLTLANHPRFAELAADPKARGILLGLWMVAARAYASATHDQVTLTHADIQWISGLDRTDHALKAVQSVAERMQYKVDRVGKTIQVTIRNFSKKQGFTPHTTGETPRSSLPSYSYSDSDPEFPPTPADAGESLDGRNRSPRRQLAQRAKAAGIEPEAIPRAVQALETQPDLSDPELGWITRTRGAVEAAIREVLAQRP